MDGTEPMEGSARSPAAGTVLNALATGTGAAFAIDRYTTATVRLEPTTPAGDGTGAGTGTTGDSGGQIEGSVAGEPDADTRLIERCVERVVDRFGDDETGSVHTESEVPMAAGLKSSSAAANATVLATLDALDGAGAVSREEAARIGVAAARDTGVTVTGAFDDASASMLGGVTVTDNDRDALLTRAERDWAVLVWTPPERAYSADADRERCEQVAPVADLVADLALDGSFGRAMTVNGLAFCAALGFSADPLLEAMGPAHGVSLSGTGPSFTAVGARGPLEAVREQWETREGTTFMTRTQTEGARIDG